MPMDQNVINLTKLYYKKGLLAQLIANDGVDLEQKIKDFNLRHAVCTLAGAWQQVSPSSIQKCWKILLPPNLEWDDEDDIPLSIIKQNMESENKIFKSMLQELAPQENFTNEEINEWVLEDCAVQEDIENISTESIDDSEVAVSPPKSPKIKDSTVVESFNICIKWCEENNIDINSILNLKEIRQKVIIKVYCNVGVAVDFNGTRFCRPCGGKINKVHNHPPQIETIEQLQLMNSIKVKVKKHH